MSLYRILDNPFIYRLNQLIFASNFEQRIVDILQTLLSTRSNADRVLELGCGPMSNLRLTGLAPIGVDISLGYVTHYAKQGHLALVASADCLPFASNSFDGVLSIGMFHHISDEMTVAALNEAMRVCGPEGYIAILDAVKPLSAWRRPIAAAIRRLDRGDFVRDQASFEKLLPQRPLWSVSREDFTATGMELVVAILDKRRTL